MLRYLGTAIGFAGVMLLIFQFPLPPYNALKGMANLRPLSTRITL